MEEISKHAREGMHAIYNKKFLKIEINWGAKKFCGTRDLVQEGSSSVTIHFFFFEKNSLKGFQTVLWQTRKTTFINYLTLNVYNK